MIIFLTRFSVEQKSRGSDLRWQQTVLSKGTLRDRVAALTVRVEEQPLRSLGALQQLLAMCKKKGRQEALAAIGL